MYTGLHQGWKCEYQTGSQRHYLYEAACEIDADIIIVKFIENCPLDSFDGIASKMSFQIWLIT